MSFSEQDALVSVLVLEASQAPASHDSLHARYRIRITLPIFCVRARFSTESLQSLLLVVKEAEEIIASFWPSFWEEGLQLQYCSANRP
jgi:hypothetical protein